MSQYQLVQYKADTQQEKFVIKLMKDGQVMYICKLISTTATDEAKNEIMVGILATIHTHGTVVPILNMGLARKFYHVFYPFISQGNLKKYMTPTNQEGLTYHEDVKRNPYVVWILIRRFMEAIQRLHTVQQIVHFDTRADNLFIDIEYDYEWLEGDDFEWSRYRRPFERISKYRRLIWKRRKRQRKLRQQPRQQRKKPEECEIRDIAGEYTYRVLIGDLGLAEYTYQNGQRHITPIHHQGKEYEIDWGTYPKEFCPSYDVWYFLICFQDNLTDIGCQHWMHIIWDKIKLRVPEFDLSKYFTVQGRMRNHLTLLPLTMIEILDEIYDDHRAMFEHAKMK